MSRLRISDDEARRIGGTLELDWSASISTSFVEAWRLSFSSKPARVMGAADHSPRHGGGGQSGMHTHEGIRRRRRRLEWLAARSCVPGHPRAAGPAGQGPSWLPDGSPMCDEHESVDEQGHPERRRPYPPG